MEQETLKPIIDTITQEVINRVNEIIKEKENKDRERLLLVFTGGTGGLDIVLKELKSLSSKYSYYAIFTPAAEKCIGKEKIRAYFDFEEIKEDDLYDTLSKINILVFPTLTQNTAAKAVYGIRDSIGSEALACGLLFNKRVIAAQDSIPLRHMPATYAHMVGEILTRLMNLGVDLCEAKNLSQAVLESRKNPDEGQIPITCKKVDLIQVPKDDQDITDKESCQDDKGILKLQDTSLITADKIYEAISKGYGKIVILPKTVVTPMAKDVAKDKNIVLEWAVK